jgi:hypothetical protein
VSVRANSGLVGTLAGAALLALVQVPLAAAQGTAQPAAGTPPAPSPGTRPLAEAIRVDAGASCLDPDTLLRRVARWLGKDRVADEIRVEVHGGEHTQSEPWFAIERGEGERSERRLQNAPIDCDQLHSALALSIALAIDASVRGEATAEPPGEAEEPVEEATPPYFRCALGALVEAASNVVSFTGVAPAATVRVELGFARWLDLRVGASASRLGDQELAQGEGSFTAELVAGRIDVCPVLAFPQLRVLACADGLVGAFRTVGYHFSGGSSTQTEPYYALGGSLELQAEVLSWLGFAASVEIVVPLQRRSIALFAADGQSVAYQETLDPIGLLIGAGPVFRFF